MLLNSKNSSDLEEQLSNTPPQTNLFFIRTPDVLSSFSSFLLPLKFEPTNSSPSSLRNFVSSVCPSLGSLPFELWRFDSSLSSSFISLNTPILVDRKFPQSIDAPIEIPFQSPKSQNKRGRTVSLKLGHHVFSPNHTKARHHSVSFYHPKQCLPRLILPHPPSTSVSVVHAIQSILKGFITKISQTGNDNLQTNNNVDEENSQHLPVAPSTRISSVALSRSRAASVSVASRPVMQNMQSVRSAAGICVPSILSCCRSEAEIFLSRTFLSEKESALAMGILAHSLWAGRWFVGRSDAHKTCDAWHLYLTDFQDLPGQVIRLSTNGKIDKFQGSRCYADTASKYARGSSTSCKISDTDIIDPKDSSLISPPLSPDKSPTKLGRNSKIETWEVTFQKSLLASCSPVRSMLTAHHLHEVVHPFTSEWAPIVEAFNAHYSVSNVRQRSEFVGEESGIWSCFDVNKGSGDDAVPNEEPVIRLPYLSDGRHRFEVIREGCCTSELKELIEKQLFFSSSTNLKETEGNSPSFFSRLFYNNFSNFSSPRFRSNSPRKACVSQNSDVYNINETGNLIHSKLALENNDLSASNWCKHNNTNNVNNHFLGNSDLCFRAIIVRRPYGALDRESDINCILNKSAGGAIKGLIASPEGHIWSVEEWFAFSISQ